MLTLSQYNNPWPWLAAFVLAASPVSAAVQYDPPTQHDTSAFVPTTNASDETKKPMVLQCSHQKNIEKLELTPIAERPGLGLIGWFLGSLGASVVRCSGCNKLAGLTHQGKTAYVWTSESGHDFCMQCAQSKSSNASRDDKGRTIIVCDQPKTCTSHAMSHNSHNQATMLLVAVVIGLAGAYLRRQCLGTTQHGNQDAQAGRSSSPLTHRKMSRRTEHRSSANLLPRERHHHTPPKGHTSVVNVAHDTPCLAVYLVCLHP